MNISKPIKTFLSVSVLGTALTLSSMSMASASTDDNAVAASKHHQGQHMMAKMSKVLLLSTAQQQQIKTIRIQAKAQHDTLRAVMKKFKAAEQRLIQATAFDETAYTTLHTAYQTTFSAIALAKAKTKHAIFQVLNTKQQAKWLKMMKQGKKATK